MVIRIVRLSLNDIKHSILEPNSQSTNKVLTFRFFVVLFFRSELRQEIPAIQKSCQQ